MASFEQDGSELAGRYFERAIADHDTGEGGYFGSGAAPSPGGS
jgi:hypothetical protein